MATIVRKISTKTVVGTPSDIRNLPDGPIMRVMGVMRGVQTGEGDNGPWVAFIGQFQAVNLKTGEIFGAAKCFLAGAASDIIESAWHASQEGDTPAQDMKFAFDIVKITNDTSAVGYEYQARPLIEAAETDPLLEMASSLPALPMIEAVEEPADTKTKKK